MSHLKILGARMVTLSMLIRYHQTKFSHYGEMALRICEPFIFEFSREVPYIFLLESVSQNVCTGCKN